MSQSISALFATTSENLSTWPMQTNIDPEQLESLRVDWLIQHFNYFFADQQVILVRGHDEPEYQPATSEHPAQIQFAHGFLSSALHEISHWCIAGAKRRLLTDFGYWYEPDGRNAAQQQLFEKVEIKPQAIEWLLHLSCGLRFRVSIDNLNHQQQSDSAFKDHVFAQARHYLAQPEQLPADARRLIHYLTQATLQPSPISIDQLQRVDLN